MNNKFSASNNFDILRLIFALLVFLYHSVFLYGGIVHNILFNIPSFAVQGFFIISGFLIVWSFDRNHDVRKYSLKRFFRTYPLYFILILIQTVIMLILIKAINLSAIFKYLSTNLVFLNFLSPSIGNVFNGLRIDAINGSLWTLKIEVAFYILLPIIYHLFSRFGKSILFLLYVASALYFLFVKNEFWAIMFPTHLRFFIAGIFMYFYGEKIVSVLKNKLFISILLIACLLFLDIYIKADLFKAFIYPAVLGLTVLLGAFCIPAVKIPLDISYSIYVLHFPILQVLAFYNIMPDNFLQFFAISSVLLLSFSIFSGVFIEKRFVYVGHKICDLIENKDKITEIKTKRTVLLNE